nr:hypothetical protein [Chitinophagaceae bacterium]
KEGKIEVSAKKEVVVEAKKVEVKEAPKANTSEFKEKQKEEKRIRNKFSKLEEEMNQLNADKSRLEGLLASPTIYSDQQKFQQTETEYNSINYKISVIQPEYEQLFEQLMQFES